MSDIVSDLAAPPDLPPEMLTAASESPASSGQRLEPAASPPGPDLPAEMLAPAHAEPDTVPEPAGPDLGGDVLVAPPDPAEFPGADPMLGWSNAPEPPMAEDTGAEAWGPSDSVPLSESIVEVSDELSFEEKWDSLARRLQRSGPGAEGTAPPVPPDLPDEMLRPTGHADTPEDHDGDNGEWR